jgi:SAM-dependent methyltransferase
MWAMSNRRIFSDIDRYYTARLHEFGVTPQGVDWNGAASQELRFAVLSRLLPEDNQFTVNDLGCGYGGYLDWLERRGYPVQAYVGYDLSAAMIDQARDRFQGVGKAQFVVILQPSDMLQADFTIASGIFNVRMHHAPDAWRDYVFQTLEDMAAKSRRGFAFNVLTSYSDVDKMRPDLFYADPCEMFDLCKRRYARNVALVHDYDLYEFTILVRLR